MKRSLYHKLMDQFVHWLTVEPPPAEIPPCDFNRLKYEIRPGDVLLVEGQSRISKVIRSISQSPWTHAALYIGRLHDIEDNYLRKLVAVHMKKRENARLIIEGLLGQGTIVTPLNEYRHHHIRICRPVGLSHADAELVIAFAIKSLGKQYNVRQILDLARFVLPWSIMPRRWGSSLFKTTTGEPESGICSTIIAEAFTTVHFPILPIFKADEESNVEMVQRNPHLFTPKDFDYSPYFEIIKYPVISTEQQTPYYRQLPWSKEGLLHHDQGIITDTTQIKKPVTFLSKLISSKRQDKKTNKQAEITKSKTEEDRDDS
jgi:hypothetical protein